MKRNFKYLSQIFAIIVTISLLISCSSKKKSLDISKEHLEQASSVKIEQKGSVTDSSKTEINEQEESWTKVVEEWFGNLNNDTSYLSFQPKTELSYRKTTYSKQTKQKDQVVQNAILAEQSVSKDSTGTLKKDTKHKVQNKEVKESTSGKLYAIGFLILVVLVAVWCIRRQQRRVKEAADLFI